MDYFQNLVQNKIRELGEQNAAEFFRVGVPLIKQWMKGTKRVSLAAVEKVFDPQQAVDELSIERADWEGKQVAILLPFYKTTNPRTLKGICSLLDHTKMTVMQRWGDAFVAHSRNKLGTQFRTSGIPWSFWLDDDMVPQTGHGGWFRANTGFKFPEKFLGQHSLNRLLSHEKSIVGAHYFGRGSAEDRAMFHYAVANPEFGDELRHNPRDEIMATEWVATGGLLVHRDVYTAIEAKFPELAPQNDSKKEYWHYFSRSETDLTKGVAEAIRILSDTSTSEEARIEEVRGMLVVAQKAARMSPLRQGEDVTFCQRAREAGHQPYVDLGLRFGHIGEYVY